MSWKPDKNDVELVPIPLDRETRERLVLLARVVGKHPAKTAGELLRDLLREDEMAHAGLIEVHRVN